MNAKNVTLKVKSELYDKYREFCKKEGLIVSRQFEKLMEERLNRFNELNNSIKELKNKKNV